MLPGHVRLSIRIVLDSYGIVSQNHRSTASPGAGRTTCAKPSVYSEGTWYTIHHQTCFTRLAEDLQKWKAKRRILHGFEFYSLCFALCFASSCLPEDEKPKRNHVVKTILCVQPFNCLTTIRMEICAGISRPSLLLLSLPRAPPPGVSSFYRTGRNLKLGTLN